MHALTHPRSATSLPAAIALTLAVAVPWVLSEAWWLEFCLTITLATAVLAGVIDADTGRIPDRLILLAAAPVLFIVVFDAAFGGRLDAASAAATGVCAFAGPLLVVHLASPPAMGFGDVKLAAALGAALGLVDPIAALLALGLASAVTVTVAVIRGRKVVPFGPGLALGAVLALVPFTSATEGSLPWR